MSNFETESTIFLYIAFVSIVNARMDILTEKELVKNRYDCSSLTFFTSLV